MSSTPVEKDAESAVLEASAPADIVSTKPAKLAANEIVVAGKRVVLRQRFPLKENADLLKLWFEASAADMNTVVPLCQRHIESWEFDGDPQDLATWEEMDVISEVRPIWNAVARAMESRVVSAPKN